MSLELDTASLISEREDLIKEFDESYANHFLIEEFTNKPTVLVVFYSGTLKNTWCINTLVYYFASVFTQPTIIFGEYDVDTSHTPTLPPTKNHIDVIYARYNHDKQRFFIKDKLTIHKKIDRLKPKLVFYYGHLHEHLIPRGITLNENVTDVSQPNQQQRFEGSMNIFNFFAQLMYIHSQQTNDVTHTILSEYFQLREENQLLRIRLGIDTIDGSSGSDLLLVDDIINEAIRQATELHLETALSKLYNIHDKLSFVSNEIQIHIADKLDQLLQQNKLKQSGDESSSSTESVLAIGSRRFNKTVNEVEKLLENSLSSKVFIPPDVLQLLNEANTIATDEDQARIKYFLENYSNYTTDQQQQFIDQLKETIHQVKSIQQEPSGSETT
jgi:hypothetical protein